MEQNAASPLGTDVPTIDDIDVDFSKFDDEDISDLGALATQHGAGVGAYSIVRENRENAHRTETVSEALDSLIKKIPDQKRILLATVNFCATPRTAEEIDEMLAEFLKYRKSVYTPEIVRSLLVREGALIFVASKPAPSTDGEAGQEVAEVTPEQNDAAAVEVEPENADGEPDWEAGLVYDESDLTYDEQGNLVIVEEETTGTWVADPEALEYAAQDDPLAKLSELLEKYPKYQEIYVSILDFCAEADRTTYELDHFVQDDPHFQPLLEQPKLFAGHFVGKLEELGALEWRGIWTITDAGKKYLGL